MRTATKRQKLETAIRELIARLPGDSFNVIAFEMQRDDCGWSVNTPFRIASRVTREEVPAIVRGRWEVIAVNYGRRSVRWLNDIAWDCQYHVSIESDHFPIVDILTVD
jgi:hypothetical protein